MRFPISLDFSGRVCVITGAAGAICSMAATALAESGASVALLDLNAARVEELAAQLTAQGYTAKGYLADVLDQDSLETARRQIRADLGPCQLLINGAGGNNPRATTDDEFYHQSAGQAACKRFFDLDAAGIQFVFELNFLGTLLPVQVFAADMAEQGYGSILNISSMNAFTPLTKIPAYSGAKAAVANFTKWLAAYFAGSGIRVNAIAPGFFVGEQNRSLLFHQDGSLTPRSGKIIAHTPMGRFGELEELAGPILFLLDEQAAGFITGVVLPIDGGFSAYAGV